MADPNEVGVTNLGPVPEGMTFIEATVAAVPLRKFKINPGHHSQRLTVCETQREIWRIAKPLPEPQRSQLQMLAGQGFDMGKRMNARMVELKAMLEAGG